MQPGECADIEKTPGTPDAGMRSLCFKVVVFAVFALGLIARLMCAWWLRHSSNGDFGICALMAKHISEGVDFPVFFYGQAYMGSLEPFVSALFCRALGFSGFAVCLGTVVFGLAALPVVYRMGLQAGGRCAALCAMLFCTIGPMGFLHYQCSSRGGYSAALFFIVFILWFTVDLVLREKNNGGARAWRYLVLGFAGGVAWWTLQLAAPAMLAGALVYLLVLRRRAFTWKIGPALAGFLVGSLPFWWWNHLNGWRSFEFFGKAGAAISFSSGIKALIPQATAMADLRGTGPVAEPVIAGILCLLVIVTPAAACLFARLRGARVNLAVATAFLFSALYVTVLARSNYSRLSTPRYLLPLVPVVGVIIGWILSGIWRFKAGKPVVAVCMALLVGWNAFNSVGLRQIGMRDRDFYSYAGSLAGFLDKEGIKGVLTVHTRHALNYLLGEKYVFCEMNSERYQPYADAVEEMDDVAVLGDSGKVSAFLAATGGTAGSGGPPDLAVRYGFRAPRRDFVPVPSSNIRRIVSSQGVDVRNSLLDRNLATAWAGHASAGGKETLTVTFREPVELAGVRLVCSPRGYPVSWRIAGRPDEEKPWEPVAGPFDVSYLFWSGPRVYHKGVSFRLESNFRPRKYGEVQILMNAPAGLCAGELQFFVPGPAADPETESCDALIGLLNERNVKRVYADRWLSGRIRKVTAGRIWTFRDPASVRMAVEQARVRMVLDGATAMVVRREDADFCGACLESCGIKMRTTQTGPWIVFDFDGNECNWLYGRDSGLDWIGFSCAVGENKRIAALLAEQAEGINAVQGFNGKAREYMEKAVRLHPSNAELMLLLAERLEAWKNPAEAAMWRQAAREIVYPAAPAVAGFGKGVALAGIDPATITVKAGEKFDMRYHWRCAPDIDIGSLVVFVHFREWKKIVFQDDHRFLDGQDVAFQPSPEIFLETRTVNVPAGIPVGMYDIWIGLYDAERGAGRLRVKTDLLTKDDAVCLPVKLQVVPAVGY